MIALPPVCLLLEQRLAGGPTHGRPREALALWLRQAPQVAGHHWVRAEAFRTLGDVEGEKAARALAETTPW